MGWGERLPPAQVIGLGASSWWEGSASDPSSPMTASEHRAARAPEHAGAPREAPRSRSFVRSLLDYCAGERWVAVFAVLVCVLHALLDLAKPLLYGAIFDLAIPQRDMRTFAALALVLAATVTVQGLGWLARARLISRLSTRIDAGLRLRLLDRVQTSALQSRSHDTPALLELFGEELAKLEAWLLVDGPRVVTASVAISVGLLAMFFLEWRLALSTLVLGGLAGVAPVLLSRAFEAASRSQRAPGEQQGLVLQDVLNLQPLIRAFGLRDYWRGRYLELLLVLGRHRQKQSRRKLQTQATTVMGVSIVQVTVVCIGIGFYLQPEGPSLGTLVGFYALLMVVVGNANRLSETMPATLALLQGVRALDAWVEAREPAPETATASLSPLREALVFDAIEFAYEPGSPVLRGLNLEVRAGESVALVGPSGSGKSTTLALLAGLQRAQRGQLRWDGLDLAQVSPTALRGHLGLVFQDPALFNTSIGENIRMGRLDASEAEIEAAARAAGVHDFVMTTPAGYATSVGARGEALSGGQRQRVALARALLRAPSVFVLDEATSALDPEVEAAVNETLLGLAGRHTILCVTHRLHGLERFDRIVVLDEGRVVEVGSHAELLANEGLYASMVRKQGGLAAAGPVALLPSPTPPSLLSLSPAELEQPRAVR